LNRPKIDGLINIPHIYVSCKTGEGIDNLIEILSKYIKKTYFSSNQNILITRERHRQQLAMVLKHLEQCIVHLNRVEVAAEDLRDALREIGKITGTVDVEQILDIIFKEFCIGK